jgi:hypothetical protein
MLSPDRFYIVDSTKPLRVNTIYQIVDNTTERRIYHRDGYTSTETTLSSLTSSIPEIASFTEMSGNTVYINCLSVLKITNTASDTGITIVTEGNTFKVNDTLENVKNTVNAYILKGLEQTQTVDTAVDYTILVSDDLIIVTDNTITLTLPEASEAYKNVTVKNATSGNLTLTPTSGDTIQGQADGVISTQSSWTLHADGTNWIIV